MSLGPPGKALWGIHAEWPLETRKTSQMSIRYSKSRWQGTKQETTRESEARFSQFPAIPSSCGMFFISPESTKVIGVVLAEWFVIDALRGVRVVSGLSVARDHRLDSRGTILVVVVVVDVLECNLHRYSRNPPKVNFRHYKVQCAALLIHRHRRRRRLLTILRWQNRII
ncbi:hypothetical protein E2C01_017395 [Portunus trituberculatus]|uniref:Uncharacterized protein n=1 Tax=Portunus trituberculatus TaxID=210409 RepID=A0A5B7DT92_PORTR|nr:hypothetical protein [Portunus trituberculatus]